MLSQFNNLKSSSKAYLQRLQYIKFVRNNIWLNKETIRNPNNTCCQANQKKKYFLQNRLENVEAFGSYKLSVKNEDANLFFLISKKKLLLIPIEQRKFSFQKNHHIFLLPRLITNIFVGLTIFNIFRLKTIR